jgi:multiple sugar transport system substrate-binding protein
MKRFTHIVAAALLVFALTIPAFAEETIVLSSRLWSRPAEQEFIINEILKPFEEEHNIKVALQIIDDDTLFDRANVQKSTGHITTDVIIVHAQRMPEWVAGDYVEDLTEIVNGWTDRTFSKGFDPMTIIDGKRYFVPIGADVYLLAANKKALQYLPEGADVQDLTWEQLVDWALATAEGEGEGKFAVTGVPQNMLIYQYGSGILSFGGGFPDVNSPGALKFWELMVKLKDAHPPTVLTYETVMEAMKRGEAWLTVTHNARVGQIYESNPAQFVIAPAPKGPAGIGSVAGTSGFAIMKGAPHKEMASKLIEYMSRPDIQVKIAKGAGGFIPPVDEALGLLGDSTQDEVIKKALHVMNSGVLVFVPPLYGPNWQSVKLVYDEAFKKLVLEDGAVDKAYLDKAQTTIDGFKVK